MPEDIESNVNASPETAAAVALVEEEAPDGATVMGEQDKGEVVEDAGLNPGDRGACASEDRDANIICALDGLAGKLDDLAEKFDSRIAKSEAEERALKDYSDKMAEYKEDLFKKITLPLLREMMEVRDAACSFVERARAAGEGNQAGGIESIEFLCDMLETKLGNYGVSVREAHVGEHPERGVDRPIGRVETDDAAKDGAIAAVMNDAYLLDGKCVAPARVKVFACVEPRKEEQQSLEQVSA